jgi:hypothetical protein
MTYRENQGVREEIDRYLKKNASRQANLGMSSTKEERLAADAAWETDLLEIEKLDPEFAKAVHAQTD